MTSYLFGKKSSQDDVDYKSRLEHKLYLARENPEPVFDLSECNLKSVPSGVYSLCKVFRKERLLLQVNQLTSLTGGGQLSDLCLLTVLDLHKNQLSTLPECICYLKNLQDLNISCNNLKKLPASICSLSELRRLDCSQNKLNSLPASMQALTRLTALDLRNNPELFPFPKCLCHIKTLQQLQCDQQLLQNVPTNIIQLGTAAILQYFSKETNMKLGEKEPECKVSGKMEKLNSPTVTLDEVSSLLQQKAQEFLELERLIKKQKDQEYKLHKDIKMDKEKLLFGLIKQQRKVEKDVSKCQTQKELERGKLVNHLMEVEKHSNETIRDMLVLNQALKLTKWQDNDYREQHKLMDYKTRSDSLRRKEVLDAMESLLAEECARKEKLVAYEKSKAAIIQSSLSQEVEWSKQVNMLLYKRDLRQTEMLSMVESDMEVQKALVATLLEQTDLHTQSLVMQVALVEQQLALLTNVELQRRDMDTQQHMNDLTEKRKTLSDLLLKLLQEQHERQKHLVHTLEQLESDREMRKNSPDFWLHHYQNLMSRPHQLISSLDPALVHELVLAKVSHYLPLLVCCHLDSISQVKLSQIGIHNVEDQLAILGAVNAYIAHKGHFLPSALAEELTAAAKPVLMREPLPECVVCMENQCSIVFVPCGHLCSCLPCATQLLLCPLCRATVERKIHAIIP